MEGRGDIEDGRSELLRLAEPAEAAPGAGCCNGYRPGGVKSVEGVIEYSAPQIGARSEIFHSLRELNTAMSAGGRKGRLSAKAVYHVESANLVS